MVAQLAQLAQLQTIEDERVRFAQMDQEQGKALEYLGPFKEHKDDKPTGIY